MQGCWTRQGSEQSPPVRTLPGPTVRRLFPNPAIKASPPSSWGPRLPALEWQTVDVKAWLSAHHHILTPEVTKQQQTACAKDPGVQRQDPRAE